MVARLHLYDLAHGGAISQARHATAPGTASSASGRWNPDTTAPDTPYTVNGYEAFYGSLPRRRAARSCTTATPGRTAAENV